MFNRVGEAGIRNVVAGLSKYFSSAERVSEVGTDLDFDLL
jgi:hypothetical protein